MDNTYSNSICSICLSEINIDNLCTTNCNHNFCNDCLNQWFDNKKISCPICRTNITTYKYKEEINRIIYIDNRLLRPSRPNRPRNLYLNHLIVNRNYFIFS